MTKLTDIPERCAWCDRVECLDLSGTACPKRRVSQQGPGADCASSITIGRAPGTPDRVQLLVNAVEKAAKRVGIICDDVTLQIDGPDALLLIDLMADEILRLRGDHEDVHPPVR